MSILKRASRGITWHASHPGGVPPSLRCGGATRGECPWLRKGQGMPPQPASQADNGGGVAGGRPAAPAIKPRLSFSRIASRGVRGSALRCAKDRESPAVPPVGGPEGGERNEKVRWEKSRSPSLGRHPCDHPVEVHSCPMQGRAAVRPYTSGGRGPALGPDRVFEPECFMSGVPSGAWSAGALRGGKMSPAARPRPGPRGRPDR